MSGLSVSEIWRAELGELVTHVKPEISSTSTCDIAPPSGRQDVNMGFLRLPSCSLVVKNKASA